MKTANEVKVARPDFEDLQWEIEKIIRAMYKEILKKPVENSTGGPLIDAIMRGDLIYKDGHFSGKFNSRTTAALKKLGAIWKKNKTFQISKLPAEVVYALALSKANSDAQIQRTISKISAIKPEEMVQKLNVEKEVDRILGKVSEKIEASVETTRLQLDPMQAEQVKKKYTENLKRDIKDWTEKEIVKLRKLVSESIQKGERYETLAKKIEVMSDRKAVGSHAKFIAEQETHLLLAEVKEQQYRKVGLNRYVWKTRNLPTGTEKGNVRPDHAALDGKVFDWDNPPIVDHKTGRRAHPGQDFRCRCIALPIIED